MTIWRLTPEFGLRQSILFLAISILVSFLQTSGSFLQKLEKYQYVIAGIGLATTLATLVWGINPAGTGSNLWLGCCGIYFQPSEFLKFGFIVLLSSRFINFRLESRPALLFVSLCSLILVVLIGQRDLGTGLIFLVLLFLMTTISINKPSVLLTGAFALILGAFGIYFTNPLLQARLASWIDPWADPSASSYQIIQSFLAIANGGLNGRGPGIGYPGLVPVAHSDFIYAAISEELGLIGALFVVSMFCVLVFTGFYLAKRQSDLFIYKLTIGISIYLGIQAVIIIGGNTGLLPLTGITLPYISYGGSSLLIAMLATLILFNAGNNPNLSSENTTSSKILDWVQVFIMSGLVLCFLVTSWWASWQNSSLLARPENPRKYIAETFVKRGDIVDRSNQPIVETIGTQGNYSRVINLPALSPILGYNLPFYGQTNIERSYDDNLRGEKGYPVFFLWWHHLLYGTPPEGLNIRTSIDRSMQTTLANYFEGKQGAGILINSNTGEIYAVVSGPYINNEEVVHISNQKGENAPLVNRISMGAYPPNLIKNMVAVLVNSEIPNSSVDPIVWLMQKGYYIDQDLGFDRQEYMPSGYFSPLMAARFFGSISNNGICPALQFVTAIKTPDSGWVILPKTTSEQICLTPVTVANFSERRSSSARNFWTAAGYDTKTNTTMYVAGTMPEWTGVPLTLVIFDEAHYSGKMKSELDDLFEKLYRPQK